MNILMATNTYFPHVGGVARSVRSFTETFRSAGHRVLVVAPTFRGTPPTETDVVRLPVFFRLRGSDFAVPLPLPHRISTALEDFAPQVVHAHHPFLLGDTALRVAAGRGLPMVFTHHTRYELYTHYLADDAPHLRRFVVELVTGYCNLCDAVIAPSRAVAELLRRRGVTAKVEAIPTGIDTERFAGGDGVACRRRLGIPLGVPVVGHVGRLAPEKNLVFLAESLAAFLNENPTTHCLVVGEGPLKAELRPIFARAGAAERLHLLGVLDPQALADAYRAMTVFAFASRSETQGLVLVEALAAGVPVVALAAPVVAEAVTDGGNGALVAQEDCAAFCAALATFVALSRDERAMLAERARTSAAEYAIERCAARTLDLYRRLLTAVPREKPLTPSLWAKARRRLIEERQIWANVLRAAGGAVRRSGMEDG